VPRRKQNDYHNVLVANDMAIEKVVIGKEEEKG